MDLANSILKDVLADATLTCEARAIEQQLTAPDTTEASMEGLGKMIGGWLKSRERKKAENAAKEGKLIELAVKLKSHTASLSKKVSRLPDNASVVVDITRWMKYFQVDGKIPADLVKAIEANAMRCRGSVEKLMNQSKSNLSITHGIVESLDVTSDEAFTTTVLNKLDQLRGGFVHSVLPGTSGQFMMGLSLSTTDPTEAFKKAQGVDKLKVTEASHETATFQKPEAAIGNHRVKLSKADLERLVRCMETYADVANAAHMKELGALEEEIYNQLTTLYFVETQELQGPKYKSGLESTKDALKILQYIVLPTYWILDFTLQVMNTSFVVGVATKQLIEETISSV